MNSGLPGEELFEDGLKDLRLQRESIPALLVAVGTPKLRQLGFDIPDSPYDFPEHRLYELLAQDNPDSAHSRYNALIRRLVSFERAAACVNK